MNGNINTLDLLIKKAHLFWFDSSPHIIVHLPKYNGTELADWSHIYGVNCDVLHGVQFSIITK